MSTNLLFLKRAILCQLTDYNLFCTFPIDMEGQIEGLSIAGRSCGLWNFKNSFKVMAARGRDRLREKNEEGLK